MRTQNFTEIVRDGERTALFDAAGFAVWKEALADYLRAWRSLWRWMKGQEYPASRKWAEAIAANGSPSLAAWVAEMVGEDAKKANVSEATAKRWRRDAVDDIGADDLATADAFAHQIQTHQAHGAPITWDDDGPGMDIEAAAEQYRPEFSRELSKDDISASEEIRAIGERLRALELQGYNALELSKKYAGETAAPYAADELSFLSDIALRRHRAGMFSLDPRVAHAIATGGTI